MNALTTLLDRALAAHQTMVQVRLAYEEAFTRLLSIREEYDQARTEWEQARRVLRDAEIDYETILKSLRDVMKGPDHEKSSGTEGHQEQEAAPTSNQAIGKVAEFDGGKLA